jgi:hypothetical protein
MSLKSSLIMILNPILIMTSIAMRWKETNICSFGIGDAVVLFSS